MWQGVTYVDPTHRPVIHEGFDNAHAIVTNAGPATVDLAVWDKPMVGANSPPAFSMRMPPGNTRSVTGRMIAVGISDNQPPRMAPPPGAPVNFAAVAWRMV